MDDIREYHTYISQVRQGRVDNANKCHFLYIKFYLIQCSFVAIIANGLWVSLLSETLVVVCAHN